MCEARNHIELSIITATYNRKELLKRAYDSLVKQTSYAFQWIIIDDGSVDGTELFCKNLTDTPFQIKYLKKDNGGKHTALNSSHELIDGDYVLWLDSDDMLLPGAVETVIKDWRIYSTRTDIGFISYLMINPKGKCLTQRASEDYYISDYIHYRVNKGISGDQCITMLTKVFKENPFPTFDNEKFLSEGWFFTKTAYLYKTVFRNVAIYVANYLDSGLSAEIRRHQCLSPVGAVETYKCYMIAPVSIRKRIRSILLCKSFIIVANKQGRMVCVDRIYRPLLTLMYPAASIVYYSYLRKYCGRTPTLTE